MEIMRHGRENHLAKSFLHRCTIVIFVIPTKSVRSSVGGMNKASFTQCIELVNKFNGSFTCTSQFIAECLKENCSIIRKLKHNYSIGWVLANVMPAPQPPFNHT